ncbi:hypothetical protein QBC40DRAFT_283526 [Triangularia verruculosa]|uniref:Mg2+ transporter protein, CorA-like/Zinc transport protein ZntB n=1 Tax=Triangularia verruculosa TaxID=2587418 RepID=A0AAN6XEA3_9PEZI|nr:hypothetical protein QBC40DRAFT_283526 [Triangularia verruculosa]
MYANKVEAEPPPPPRHFNPPPPVRRGTNPYDVDETRSNHVRFPAEYDYYSGGVPPLPPSSYQGYIPRQRSPPPPPSTYYRPAHTHTNHTRPSSRRTHHTATHTRYTSPSRYRDRRDYSPVSPAFSPAYSPAYSPTSPVLVPTRPRRSSIKYEHDQEYNREARNVEIIETRRDATSDEEADWRYKRAVRKKRTIDGRDDDKFDEDLDLLWEPDHVLDPGPTRNPVATGPYSFVPPGTPKDPLGDAARLSDDDSLDTADHDSMAEVPERLSGAAYQVLESGYIGDGMIGGQHGAQLVITPGEKIQHQPVFRWVHFNQKTMDFDGFATQATRLVGLSKNERQAVTDLIARIQRQGIKQIQTSNGSYVRHMEPKFLQLPLPFDPSLKQQCFANRTISWICLPYFSLEKYSGLLAAESSSSFPVETLLQAQFSRATKDRDMQQAVRQLKGAPAELCFHISQLWCIVLDNTLLLTCGRMPFDALCGNLIHKVIKTPQEITSLKPPARVFIRYQNNIVWALPIEECESWFSFMAHFLEFWPRVLSFFYFKRPVKSDDWPWICKLASRSRAGVLLEMQIGHKPALPSPAALTSLQQENPDNQVQASTFKQPDNSSSQRKTVRIQVPQKGKRPEEAKPLSSFSVFTCLEGVANSAAGGINHDVLKDYFTQVDQYLLNKTARQDRGAYSELRKSSRNDVYKLLEEEGNPSNDDIPSSERKMYEGRVSFFNKADLVFKFFFPPDVEVPTVDRFWGIIMSMIEHPSLEDPEDPADPRSREMNKARRALQMEKLSRQRTEMMKAIDRQVAELSSFNSTFSSASPSDLNKVHTPWLLVDAWIHILLGLAIFPKNTTRSEFLMDSGLSSIRQGVDEMIQSVANSFERPLFDRSVLLPMDLVSLMSMTLLKDITPGLPDISETYSSYLDTIESDITTKSSNRTHEYKLGRLKQEMSIVQWTVAWQRSIFDAMSQSSTRSWKLQPRSTNPFAPAHRGAYAYHSLPAADSKVSAHGYRQLLIDEIVSFLDRRDKEFNELRNHASHLEEFNRNKLDTTRDRQERAIYAFTIVTIIFLPLSSIASIFGMNSSDVRDMELGQWAYWATAVPVTIFVIFLGLWWTGEMGNVMRAVVEWFQSFGERERYRRGWREREEDMVPMMAYSGGAGGGRVEPPVGWREKGRFVVEGARKRR